jgi:uncharacterized protein YndB with AHSA1/START domain
MELKTKIHAEPGKQELFINRRFELPVELLFKAYSEAELIEQWMGNKVIKHESKRHGAYEFEAYNPEGKLVLKSHGIIHTFEPNQCIIRTFEMENTHFPPHLEYLTFKAIDAENSELEMHVVYKSIEARDQILKMPFEYGINMAHQRLEQLFNTQA